MDRRAFLELAAQRMLAHGTAPGGDLPVIDTHIHLFDPTRPEGVPWPAKDNTIVYRPALPSRYRALARPLGVTGAIEIECSPWLEDNQWVLNVAAKDSIVVGTVGNLDPGNPAFYAQLERFAANPLFRGIRYGYLWGRNLRAELSRPQFVAGLKSLAEVGLELDTAGPSLRLLEDVVRLTDLVPTLRVVIDHLPELDVPPATPARATYSAALDELSRRPLVYVKLSGLLRRSAGRVISELSFYRPKLDEIWERFGPDRLLYASDWPNSDPVATYAQVLKVVREYFARKGREAAEKFFWKNSAAAYRWVKRAVDQP